MQLSPLAGKPAEPAMLVNVPRLVTAYYAERPDPAIAAQRVVFGTSGHRGSAFDVAFNEAHILATTQAIWRCSRSNRTEEHRTPDGSVVKLLLRECGSLCVSDSAL
jgi:hypothetical protein